jgi:hypothetical protein
VGGALVEHIDDNQITQPDPGTAAAAQVFQQPFLDGIADLQDNGRHGNSFRSRDRVLGTHVHEEFPFFLFRESPGVQLIHAR